MPATRSVPRKVTVDDNYCCLFLFFTHRCFKYNLQLLSLTQMVKWIFHFLYLKALLIGEQDIWRILTQKLERTSELGYRRLQKRMINLYTYRYAVKEI